MRQALLAVAEKASASITLLPGETLIATITADQPLSASGGTMSGSRLQRASQRIKALTDLIADVRIFIRLWGLLSIWQWGKAMWSFPPRDLIIKRIVWAQVFANVAYQSLENAAYLAQHGVLFLDWSEGKRNRAWLWSARFWAAHVLLDLGRLWRLRRIDGSLLGKSDGVVSGSPTISPPTTTAISGVVVGEKGGSAAIDDDDEKKARMGLDIPVTAANQPDLGESQAESKNQVQYSDHQAEKNDEDEEENTEKNISKDEREEEEEQEEMKQKDTTPAASVDVPNRQGLEHEEQAREKEVKKVQEEWWRQFSVNAAYLPLTIHWSLDGGLVSDLWVGLFGSVAGFTGLKRLWEQTR